MKRCGKFLLLLLLFLSRSSWAEIDLNDTLFKSKLGQWIRVQSPGKVETTTVITKKNKKFLTLEVHTTRKNKPQSWVEQVYRLADKQVLRCRILYPDGQMDELPFDQIQIWLDTIKGHNYNLVGEEEIKVPAGTFSCSHYRAIIDDNLVHIWINSSVPLTGLVKSRFRGGSTVLLDYGQEGVAPVFK